MMNMVPTAPRSVLAAGLTLDGMRFEVDAVAILDCAVADARAGRASYASLPELSYLWLGIPETSL